VQNILSSSLLSKKLKIKLQRTIIVWVMKPRMRWAVHVTRMGERSGVYMTLVGKPEGKRSLGRPRRRWEDNINMLIITGAFKLFLPPTGKTAVGCPKEVNFYDVNRHVLMC